MLLMSIDYNSARQQENREFPVTVTLVLTGAPEQWN